MEADDHHCPRDLFDMELASNMGAAARNAGFGNHSNIYRGDRSREGKLKSWAWELGWRECQWLTMKDTEKRVEAIAERQK
jgi:hypothetical protein